MASLQRATLHLIEDYFRLIETFVAYNDHHSLLPVSKLTASLTPR